MTDKLLKISQRLIKWDTDFPVNSHNGYAGLKELDAIIADAKVAVHEAGASYEDDFGQNHARQTKMVGSRPSLCNVAIPDVAGDSSSGPSIVSSEIHTVLGLDIVSEEPGKKRRPDYADEDDGLRNVHVPSFQSRVQPWMMACFGPMIAADRQERNHRFLEEAIELVQSTGCTESEAHQLVDYVYGRAIGEPHQEVGGVMVTLAALCLANALDMHDAAETELARVWTKVEQIRAKQSAKPKHSPLPGPSSAEKSR